MGEGGINAMKSYVRKAKKHDALKVEAREHGKKRDSAYHGEVAKRIRLKKRNVSHVEKRRIFRAVKAYEDARKFGSKGLGASIIAGAAMNANKAYRVRWGYIDEKDLSSNKLTKVGKITKDVNKAMTEYKSKNWLSQRDSKGRRKITIECSSDGGKTWTGNIFSDCQHW